MKIRSLRADEMDELFDLLAVSFSKNGIEPEIARQNHKRAMASDPDFQLDLNRVVEVDGRLAARIGIHDRKMYFNGKLLRVGAIGGVCTAPQFRGRGFARALLEDCTNHMRANGFDLSLLFGEPAIYGKSGWQTLSAFGMSTNFKIGPGTSPVVRPVDIARDAALLARMHDHTSSVLNGPFARTEKYWRTWVDDKIQRKKNFKLLLVEQAGRPLGYYAMKGDAEVCELGWDIEVENAFETLARAILANVGAMPLKFSFFLPALFDFIADNSMPPSLDDMRRQTFHIQQEALYCGLFKLINANLDWQSTAQLNDRLRHDNYVFWDMDHF